MKVLFVSSGNNKFGISPIVKAQGESLKKSGIELEYYTIKGKGFLGYLKYVIILRKYLKKNDYDLIHAHYSLSGIVASLASKDIPVVVSLMGSDIHVNLFNRYVVKFFYKFRWNTTIVKSQRMQKQLSLLRALVIPNGVDFRKFKPITRSIAQERIGFDPEKKHIIFVADPNKYVKNFELIQDAFKLIQFNEIELHVVNNVDHNLIPFYMNAADVLILTSFWEGSPNVIKEAMAVNTCAVSVDVGDVVEVINNTEGYYIASYDPEDIADKIKMAINFGKRTNGREKIKHLEINNIAQKIISIYEKVINRNDIITMS